MRASVASISKKLISTLFAATLAVGLVPAAAFADVSESENSEAADAARIDRASDESDAYENLDTESTELDESVGASFMERDGEEEPQDNASTGEDVNRAILANNVINQTMPLETVAQQESTRSYFLAQTLESTRTIPMVSANLPLDEGVAEEVVESDGEGAPEEEASEDSDESDLWAAPIASESTVIGSFTSRGLTYAVEPGGETVALVAADHHQLPTEFVDAQTVVIPAVVTPDAVDYYSVTRIADYTLSSLACESVGACFSLRNEDAGTEDNAEVSAATPTLDASDGASENGITTLTIPESVTTIDAQAFTDFATLQYLVVSPDNSQYSSFDGCLYTADQNRLLLIPEGRLGAVRVAPSVTEVDPEAFSHCPSVTTLAADANSAAHQLLSENDFYNANGDKIDVITAEKAADTPTLHSPSYTETISVLGDGKSNGLYEDGLDLSGIVFESALSYAGKYSIVYKWSGNTAARDLDRWFGRQPEEDIWSNDRTLTGNQTYSVNFIWGSKTGSAACLFTWESSGSVSPYGGRQSATHLTPQIPAGYRFIKWTLGGNDLPDKAQSVMGAGDLVPVIQANTSNIVYNGNGNTSGSTATTVVTYDQNVTLRPNGFLKTGYSFDGWNTKADGTGTSYADGHTFTKPNFTTANNVTALTLYAQWTPKTYGGEIGLELNLQGGDYPFPAQTISPTYDAPLPTKDPSGVFLQVPRRPGYEFAGFWSTKYDESDTTKKYYDKGTNGTTLVPIDDKTWDIDSSDPLYAHWRYRIAFDGNTGTDAADISWGASVPTDPNFMVVTEGAGAPYIEAIDGAPVPLPQATRTGYAATRNWGLQPTTGETDKVGWVMRVTNDGYSAKANGTTLAKASPAEATYVTNGASGDQRPEFTFSGTTLTLYANWAWDPDDPNVTDDIKGTSAGANTYTVTLNARQTEDGMPYDGLIQDFVGTPAVSVTATFNKPLPQVASVKPTMTGYEFLGYYDAPQTMAVTTQQAANAYAPGAKRYYDKDGNPTTEPWRTADAGILYAHYYQKQHTLTFELGDEQTLEVKVGDETKASIGAAGARTASIQVFYGMSMGNITAKPVKPGATFQWWRDNGADSALFAKDGSGAGQGTYDKDEDMTLTPKYQEKEYAITWKFDYDEGGLKFTHGSEAGLESQKIMEGLTRGTTVAIPDHAPYKAYAFKGWSTDIDGAKNFSSSKNALAKYFTEQNGTYRFMPDVDTPDAITIYAAWDRQSIPEYDIVISSGGKSTFDAGYDYVLSGDNQTKTYKRHYGDESGPIDLTAERAELERNAKAGWVFTGWHETTGGTDVAYTKASVPLGTGNRTFAAQWTLDSSADYRVSFFQGREVSDFENYPYDEVSLQGESVVPFDAETETIDIPTFARGDATVTETLGFTFAGWYPADSQWKALEGATPLDLERDYRGQDFAEIAKAANTDKLYYVAKWEPKDFTVAYKYSKTDDDPMATDASTVSYLNEATIAWPTFQRDKAEVFQYWEGTITGSKFSPGTTSTVASIVKAAGEGSVSTQGSVSTVTLCGKWIEGLSFTVPVTVNIAIDPERAEGTKVGAGFIKTTSTRPVYVQSVKFERGATVDEMFALDGTSKADKVALTIKGDKPAQGQTATELEQNLGANEPNIHTDLAQYGLGTLQASNGGEDVISLTYDLKTTEDDLSFLHFKKLADIKDNRNLQGVLESFELGTVFYTLAVK